MSDPNRRFAVEEISNGWLVKVTEAGSDKLLGRYAFNDLPKLFEFLKQHLSK